MNGDLKSSAVMKYDSLTHKLEKEREMNAIKLQHLRRSVDLAFHSNFELG